MSIEASEFRRVLAHWTTGVAIVATRTQDGTPRGLTATAVASLSLAPPLVLACLERSAHTHDALREAGVFSINILAHGGEATARRFAGDDTPGKFQPQSYHTAATGAPILNEAFAWVDCRVHAVHDGGDHTIFVGEVIAGDVSAGEPLVYWRGRYTTLAP